MDDDKKEIPKVYTRDDIAEMVRREVTPKRLQMIIQAAVTKAIEGDGAARAWVLSHLEVTPEDPFYRPPYRRSGRIEVEELPN